MPPPEMDLSLHVKHITTEDIIRHGRSMVKASNVRALGRFPVIERVNRNVLLLK